MKLISLSLVLLLGMGGVLLAQQKSVLDSRNKRKIERANKKISKGDAIVNKKDKYTKQIEVIDSEGSGRKGKVRRLEKKSNVIIVTSASYYKEGYGIKYNTYKKAVSKAVKEENLGGEVEGMVFSAKKDYKIGRKLRRKCANLDDVNKAASMLLEANDVEKSAIEYLIKAAGSFELTEILEEPSVKLIEDTIVEIADTTSLISPTTAVIPLIEDSIALDTMLVNNSAVLDSVPKMGAVLAVDSTLLINTNDSVVAIIDFVAINPEVAPLLKEPMVDVIPKLYFSVQFLAEKQPVTIDKLNSLYDGPYEVIKHEADDWVRYSFGRFISMEEANQMKSRSGVQGYVVAYHNEIRISTRKAVEMMTN